MENTSIPPKARTVSFVDEQGRTITIPAPPTQIPLPRPNARTVEDTNITHKFVSKEGVVRETAITLRDDSIQEIFERVPALLTRYGSGIVLGVLVMVLTVMAFVQFPNTITATTTIRVVPATAANDIPKLQASLAQARRTSEELFVPLPEEALQLDPIQIPYQEFLLAYETYRKADDRQLLLVALRQLDQLEAAIAEWRSVQVPGPTVTGTHFAALELPVAVTASLQLGQTVNLELAKYPAGRYGRLNGTVSHIQPPLTLEKPYQVTVTLPDRLVTSKGIPINFENGLLAEAVIITDRNSLVTKILWH
ncbi:MAG: hypothetical protein AAFU67_08880 [Bacteroidota bacterium]